MRKIISLFQRNYYGDRQVRDEIVPGAEWVVAGEGLATRKFDGTCCMVRGGKLFKRYDAKHGKTPPPNFEPAQDADTVTGHRPGWLPVGEGPEDQYFRQAIVRNSDWGSGVEKNDGTYEFCGPHVQGNPESFIEDCFVPHGCLTMWDCPRTFAALKAWFETQDIEGIVWHHPDGRMVKIKKKDFGLPRKPCTP